MSAVRVPEDYGGAGADAIATVIVIEEVARACASSSLIPAVNKLGTVPDDWRFYWSATIFRAGASAVLAGLRAGRRGPDGRRYAAPQ
jgi:alkylation response protein AidB-like acyl-CoA dehydrogenase